jgi:hypothetical protein
MLRGMPADASRSEEPPSRMKIFPWGEVKTRDGSFTVNEEAVASIKRRMSASRRDRVRIDREHTTAFKPPAKRNPKDIFGYGDLEVKPGEGIFLANITWTRFGKEGWTALPDISPAFNDRKSDRVVTNLDSVALCCDGEVEGLTLCSADGTDNTDNTGIYLEPTPESMNELVIQLLKKMGVAIPDGTTEADIQALAMKHLEGGGGGETAEKKKEGEDANVMSAMEARLKKMEAAETARQLSADKAAREELKRQATAAGKVIPLTDAEIEDASVKTLSAIVAGLPAGTVPLEGKSGRAAGESQPGTETQVTLSAADRTMCSLYGLTEEEFKQYHAA